MDSSDFLKILNINSYNVYSDVLDRKSHLIVFGMQCTKSLGQ